MISLVKAILSDIRLIINRVISYVYFNTKGVRITFSCQVSMKAKIAKGCIFTGSSIITEEAAIGAYTYGQDIFIHNATVGEYCSIGPGVKIGLDEHSLDFASTHPHFYQKIKQDKAIIKDHVWIGANSIVLCGVKLDTHSVVGAGAVVTKDIDKFSIVGGVPAKIIKKRNIIND